MQEILYDSENILGFCIFSIKVFMYGVILSMSLKQFGKKLLTIHVPSMRHSSKHNSCCIIFEIVLGWIAEWKKHFPEEEPGDPVLLEIKIYLWDFFWNILVAQNQIKLQIKGNKKGYQNETYLKTWNWL